MSKSMPNYQSLSELTDHFRFFFEEVLDHLRGPFYEPLVLKPLNDLTMETLFLLSLATAKLVGELQALPVESLLRTPIYLCPLPQSFLDKSRGRSSGGEVAVSCQSCSYIFGRYCFLVSSSSIFVCFSSLPFEVFLKERLVILSPSRYFICWSYTW